MMKSFFALLLKMSLHALPKHRPTSEANLSKGFDDPNIMI